MMDQKDDGFWRWLLCGSGAGAGCLRVINWWLILHFAVGAALGFLTTDSLKELSRGVLLPLAGVLVGLAFAWAGNAQALLQTEQIREFSKFRPGGFKEYVFTYQLAILVLLVTLSFWGIGGTGIWDNRWPTARSPIPYVCLRVTAFSLLSLSIRECWHVVLGAQLMLLIRKRMQDAQVNGSDDAGK